MEIAKLEKNKLSELRQLAREMEVPGHNRLKKDELILGLLRANAEKKGLMLRGGVLEVVDDGIGFLRSGNLLPGRDDVYVSQSQIRRFGMRTGDMVIGQVRVPKESEKYHGLIRVEAVNGMDPEEAKGRPIFESLTPIFPEERFDLETDRHALATRLINLVAPIGKGQRGLIVSPPKAGKTMILQSIAQSITHNHPEVHLIVLLIKWCFLFFILFFQHYDPFFLFFFLHLTPRIHLY